MMDNIMTYMHHLSDDDNAALVCATTSSEGRAIVEYAVRIKDQKSRTVTKAEVWKMLEEGVKFERVYYKGYLMSQRWLVNFIKNEDDENSLE